MANSLAETFLKNLPQAVMAPDAHGRIAYANPAAGELLGGESDDLVEQPVGSLLPDLAQALQGSGGSPTPPADSRGDPLLLWAYRLDGTYLTVAVRSVPLPDCQLVETAWMLEPCPNIADRDLDELRSRDRWLHTFHQILDNLGAYVFCKDEHFRYTYANALVCELFERPRKAVIGQTDGAFFGETARELVAQSDRPVVIQNQALRQEELVYVASKGEYRTFLAVKNPLYDEQGRVCGLYGISTDITDRKRREENLAHRANHDALTQVLNRSGAEPVLEQHAALADRYGTPLSLALIDLDEFKAINDRWGHQTGDQVLRQFCVVLKNHLREADALVRWGGEEFLVIAPETDVAGANELAERLRKAVRREAFADIGEGEVTFSVGLAQYQPPESLRELFHRADSALYRAKEGGGDRVEQEG